MKSAIKLCAAGAAALLWAGAAQAQTIDSFTAEYLCSGGTASVLFDWTYSDATSVSLERETSGVWGVIYQGSDTSDLYHSVAQGTTTSFRIQACSATSCGAYVDKNVTVPKPCVNQ
ncbi:MAG: hypothetical protein JWR07_3877 [Nevskia sp.]|nr:hypothetical protein [Nevskia sp.]